MVRRILNTNRTRVFLTLLGIMIGAGSIVMLAGLLQGGLDALVRMNQGVSGSDTLYIHKAVAPGPMRDKPQRALSRSDGALLSASPQLPGVDVTIESRLETTAHHLGKQKRVRLLGTDERAKKLYQLSVLKGRFINAQDAGRRVAVIGHEIYATLLMKTPKVLGLQLMMGGVSWTIVGVLKDKPPMGSGTGTWMWGRKVVVPRAAFDASFSPKHEIHSIFLKAQNAGESKMVTLGRIASQILLRRHLGVKNFKVQDRNGQAQEKTILLVIRILLIGTGLLSMLVGGINIMNIMLVTVTERTREIGIRRAVGAPPKSILKQFLLESALTSLTGGVAGVLGGVLFGELIGLGLARAFGAWTFYVEPWSIALGLFLALFTGLFFGLFPAYKASRLDPVEALRR